MGAFYHLWFIHCLTEGVEKALLADIAPSYLRGTVIGLQFLRIEEQIFNYSFKMGSLLEEVDEQIFNAG